MEQQVRITALVGAGAILDFDLPEGVNKPSTQYITDQVVGLQMQDYKTGQLITAISDAYEALKKQYPVKPHFEMLFHVLEMWYAYGWVWKDPANTPKNPSMYPVFAPFTQPTQSYNVDSIRQAMYDFLLKVMDIINTYNAPYLADKNFNDWYRDFWQCYGGCWDVFNLNYDTTIEHSIDCEDGFADIPEQKDFQHFSPQKLWSNACNKSTLCHLHGCIEFFDERYAKEVYKKEVLKYDFHDMYKYDSYDKVRGKYVGSSKSFMSNQAGEQLVGTPIITGLRKNDKLNTIPFDFYHGHLFNSILRNNSLLLVGYSFGDVYLNHVIERMELIHGERKRVVLIDWWPLYGDEDYDTLTESEEKSSFVREMMKQRMWDSDFNNQLGYFLCRMSGVTSFEEVADSFINYDRSGPIVSKNGCLMLFIGGFKAASAYKEQIYAFLNS